MQLSSQTVYTSIIIFLTQATLALQSSVPRACPPSNTILPATLTQAIPFYSLATSYPRAITSDQNPSTVSQIRNTLALYPLAIDGKNFAALSLVFTPDVVANYSAPLNVLTGLATVQATLQQSLMYVDTQHSYGTQVIEVLARGCTAKSVTYFTASHFGRGKYSGQVGRNWCFSIVLFYYFLEACRPFMPINRAIE
ncbi:MAG: hypothetical protein Q9187_006911, partial [Circinaria calcarea]